MKLRFSVPVPLLHQRGHEITSLILGQMPGSAVFTDEAVGILYVSIPQGVDPAVATDTVCRLLSSVGVPVTPLGAAIQNGAPAPKPYKEPKKVPLSVFIVSLIGVALAVAMLTVFITGALSPGFPGFSLFPDTTLGTGEQEGEDYAGKIALIDSIFEEYALYDTDGELLLDEMLKAYAAATGDTYAAYYTEAEYQLMVADNNAKIVGIGITAIEDATHHDILIINVLPGSPALAAGLQAGDRIVSIGEGENKVKVTDVGYAAAVNLLRGEAGTTVHFTALRGETEIPFAIERAAVQTLSVTGKVSETDPSVGHVRITGFDTVTPVQFKAVMTDLIEKGCTKFVYDVRNNPGGDLKSVIAVLSYFLNENDTILSTVQKDGTATYYQVEEVTLKGDYAGCSVQKNEIGMYRSYPAVVVANGKTASAAELFTAALKEYQLAEVVGENTYGKGVIQHIYHLKNWGYTGAVKLTVGYYSPPSGVNYDGVGIAPDKEVKLSEAASQTNLTILPEGEDAQLQAAIADLNQ